MPKTKNRRVPYTAFPSGRLPDNGFASGKAVWGNARRARQQSSLGRLRRPPRSFPGGAVLPQVPKMAPLREMTERGREAAPKAGLGIQEQRRYPITGAGSDAVDRFSFRRQRPQHLAAPHPASASETDPISPYCIEVPRQSCQGSSDLIDQLPEPSFLQAAVSFGSPSRKFEWSLLENN